MPYTDNAYIPPTFDELLQIVVEKWNIEFKTNFDVETFKGTNAYRFTYVFLQTQIQQQAAVAEIFEKLQDYFEHVNGKINNPKTTNDSIAEVLRSKGFTASVRNNTEAQSGRLAVAVVVDTSSEDYPKKKNEILVAIKNNSVAGLFYDGTERGELQLSNGQVFSFAFSPAEKIPTQIKLTITYARGTAYARLTDDEAKEKLLFNLSTLYTLGNDFTPEKYFEINRDAPYAANIELQYSNAKTGGAFTSNIYTAAFTDLFTFKTEDITVTQNE